jgi:hypothetical protein
MIRVRASAALVFAFGLWTGCGSSSSGPSTDGGSSEGGSSSGGPTDGGAGSSASSGSGSNSSSGSSSGGSGSGSSSGEGGAAPPTGDAGDGCTAFVTAYCSQLLACALGDFTRDFGSTDVCFARSMSTCTTELTAPGTTLTSAAMASCGHAIRQQTCTAFRTAAPPECLPQGTLASGAGCEFSSQCASGFCDAGFLWCGHCADRVGVGGACFTTFDLRLSACQVGLTCSQGTCVTPVMEGGACTDMYNQCQYPLACVGKKCVQPLPLGASGCVANTCTGDDYCSRSGTCDATTYEDFGAACDLSFEGEPCVAGANCQATGGTPATTVGTCVADVPDGQPCTYVTQCAAPAICTDGTCQGVVDPSTCK